MTQYSFDFVGHVGSLILRRPHVDEVIVSFVVQLLERLVRTFCYLDLLSLKVELREHNSLYSEGYRESSVQRSFSGGVCQHTVTK